jgi:flagellar operon protein
MIRDIHHSFPSGNASVRPAGGAAQPSSTEGAGRPFADILKEKMDGTVSFSRHALKRINSRQIEIAESQIVQFKEVMRKLEDKGVRESLVLMQDREKEDLAFVVNVKNRTVVTALTEAMMKENIFTNIDSTVVIKK